MIGKTWPEPYRTIRWVVLGLVIGLVILGGWHMKHGDVLARALINAGP